MLLAAEQYVRLPAIKDVRARRAAQCQRWLGPQAVEVSLPLRIGAGLESAYPDKVLADYSIALAEAEEGGNSLSSTSTVSRSKDRSFATSSTPESLEDKT